MYEASRQMTWRARLKAIAGQSGAAYAASWALFVMLLLVTGLLTAGVLDDTVTLFRGKLV
jgi:hypothetical protein